jgi:NTP pyrophosphatase (non-canonical NTP hydrolase)
MTETINKTNVRIRAQVLIQNCHTVAIDRGWWTDRNGLSTRRKYDPAAPNGGVARNIGELLCLIHSEISEAMEGARKGLMDDHLPDRTMLEVELADAAIRIFDMAGGLGLDLAGAIADKLEYNSTRQDHDPENRKKEGGKRF